MQQLEHDIWAGMVDELTGIDDPDAWQKAKIGDCVRLRENWMNNLHRGDAEFGSVVYINSDHAGYRLCIKSPSQPAGCPIEADKGSWAKNTHVMEIVNEPF